MEKICSIVVAFLLLGLIIVTLGQAAPTPVRETRIAQQRASAPSVTKAQGKSDRPAWQTKWDKTLADARKEGSVSLYTMWSPSVRAALTKAFKERYGINLEMTAFAQGSDLTTKIQADQRAGFVGADVIGAGLSNFSMEMKPVGVIGNIEPLLILPEVKNPKYWMNGVFPWLDKDKKVIAMMFSIQSDIIYNTGLIKEGEISTYSDLLKPQYKGKITMSDPTVAGAAEGLMRNWSYNVWDADRAKVFLKQLLTQQDLVIQRDNRLHIETIARGKYAIGLAPRGPILIDFLKAGAPLVVVDITEAAIQASPGSSCMAASLRAPHPNAAAVFVNWLLTKEGQSIFAEAFGSPSLRIDASTKGILPMYLPKPGRKYFLATEELTKSSFTKVSRQLIEEAEAAKR